jgi:ATP-dependent phosphoenolpyruvate carboxykinase
LACQHRVFLKQFRWTHGKYGVGKRIKFEDSVAIIDAINDGSL